MIPLFTNPLAFIALAGVPALTAIYWLRNRSRRYAVSSLMLWAGLKETREGGSRLQRLQLPLLFFLELLAILLLAGAAAGPFLRVSESARPIVVVLDDSFSMLAGGDDSPRQRAIEALTSELDQARASLRFILAGERAQLLGDAVRTSGAESELLRQWTCRSSSANIDQAVQLAAEMGGDRAVILVVSDHAPLINPEKGKLQWWAFGTPRPNLAFVNAVRTDSNGRSRCLLEIANFAPSPQTTILSFDSGEPFVEFKQTPLTLAPRETRRLTLELKEVSSPFRARLTPDDLLFDNQIILLPTQPRTVRCEVQIGDTKLRGLVEKAIKSMGNTLLTSTMPDLYFTDNENDRPAASDCWTMKFMSEKDADAYLGPFVLDRTHPLTEGLALQGVIWGAGKSGAVPGLPVVTAGNIPLLTDLESAGGRHEIVARLRLDLATLQESPGWPILIWNLINWRADHLPGLKRSSVRLGEEVVLQTPPGGDVVTLLTSGGAIRALPIHEKRVVVRAEDVGLNKLHAGASDYPFAVNVLFADESDLANCASGRWGSWMDETSLRLEYRGVAWIVLVVGLSVLTAHLALMSRSRASS